MTKIRSGSVFNLSTKQVYWVRKEHLMDEAYMERWKISAKNRRAMFRPVKITKKKAANAKG